MSENVALYSDTIAQQAIDDIHQVMKGVSMTVAYEIQDYGDFLLLSIELEKRPDKAKLEEWYQILKKHFSEKFPKPIDPTEGYSWMICIKYQGFILDSVMDKISMP